MNKIPGHSYAVFAPKSSRIKDSIAFNVLGSPVFVDRPVCFAIVVVLLVWKMGSLIQCHFGSEKSFLKLAHACVALMVEPW